MMARGGAWARLGMLVCALAAFAASADEAATADAPSPLGVSEQALRAHYGDALREAPVARTPSLYDRIAEAQPGAEEVETPDPFAGQQRLARPGEGDVQRIELELHEARVFRVRWRLSERFERPLMPALVAHVTDRLGAPDYDQTLPATLGSKRSELRRTGWTVAGRAFELRQLHPFTGGPMFLSVSDPAALQAIVAAGGTPLPQPESTGGWWRRPQREPRLPSEAEREALVGDVGALVTTLLGSSS
jgi:hypothetical protein